MKDPLARKKPERVLDEAPAMNNRSETNTKPCVVGRVLSTTSKTHPTTCQSDSSDGSAFITMQVDAMMAVTLQ